MDVFICLTVKNTEVPIEVAENGIYPKVSPQYCCLLDFLIPRELEGDEKEEVELSRNRKSPEGTGKCLHK